MFISIDLDDTLLRSDKSISDKSLNVLKKLQDLGHIIIINTARSKEATNSLIETLHPDFVSVNAGSLVFDKDNNVIYSDPIEKRVTDQIVKEVLKYTNNVSIQTFDTLFTTNPNNTTPFARYYRDQNFLLDSYKILPYKLDKDIALEISKKYNVNYTSYFGGNWSRFSKEPNNKLKGLEVVVEYCNGNMNDTISFGDDYGDVPMLDGSFIGVAMSNGVEEVVKNAKYVCDSCDNDGVAKFLSEYFKLEE